MKLTTFTQTYNSMKHKALAVAGVATGMVASAAMAQEVTPIETVLEAVDFDGVQTIVQAGALAVIGVFLLFVGIRVAKRLAGAL